jgi:hypothetical protein
MSCFIALQKKTVQITLHIIVPSPFALSELQLSLVQLLNPNNVLGVFWTFECFSTEPEPEAYPERARRELCVL